MNEEEKKAIKMLDKFTTEHKFYNIKHSDNLEDNIEIVLKLIEKLQKENQELKNKIMEKKLEIIGKEEYTKASMGEIIEQYYTANEECIPIQKVKDKIEKLNDDFHAEELEDIMIGGNYTITELVQYVLQELIEEREEK